jgi:hypothetical protein
MLKEAGLLPAILLGTEAKARRKLLLANRYRNSRFFSKRENKGDRGYRAARQAKRGDFGARVFWRVIVEPNPYTG